MTQNTSKGETSSAATQAQRALSTVNSDCGFHFYPAIGDYTGVTATSLQDLAEKMREVSVGSVRFHYERGDLQRWIRTFFCDQELAEQIGLIKPTFSDEMLRREITDQIEENIGHLKAKTA
jgi:hypothetical protein